MAVVSLILLGGESNSGGLGDNSLVLPWETGPHSELQIFNPDTEVFEDLEIGVNNLMSHTPLVDGSSHGFELGLWKTLADGAWDRPVFLLKFGHGGSTVAQWADGDPTTYQTQFYSRVAAAISELTGMGHTIQYTFWLSIGLNDINQAVPKATFKSGLIDWISRLRGATSASARVLLTQFEDSVERADIVDAIDEVANEVDDCTAVATPAVGIPTGAYHWDYYDLKTIAFDLSELSIGWVAPTLLDSLKAYWPMDEASGNAIDAHDDNDMTETSGTIGSAAGILGNARVFASADTEYFELAHNADIARGNVDYTEAMWIYSTSTSQQVAAIKGGAVGNAELDGFLNLDAGGAAVTFYLGVNDTLTQTVTATGWTQNAWHLVVYGWDAGFNLIFIQLDGGTRETYNFTGPVNSGTSSFKVGAYLAGAVGVDGMIGPVMRWNRVLSEADVTELYNGGEGRAYPFSVNGAASSVIGGGFGGLIIGA